MTVDEVINKFKSNSSYLRNGSKHLSQRFNCSEETIKQARLKFKLFQLEPIKNKKIKRLFFDIETAPNIGFFWKSGHNLTINPENIIEERKIICICYKWSDSNKVHSLTWGKNQDDRNILENFIKIAESANEVCGHNSENFDIKWLRTRCLFHRIECPTNFVSLDTFKKARTHFNFNSNKLDYIAKFLGIGEKLPTGFNLWKDIILNNSSKAMNTMIEYCMNDVVILEKVYNEIQSYISKNTNHAVLQDLPKYCCPECTSDNIKFKNSTVTLRGTVYRNVTCNKCKCQYKLTDKVFLDFVNKDVK